MTVQTITGSTYIKATHQGCQIAEAANQRPPHHASHKVENLGRWAYKIQSRSPALNAPLFGMAKNISYSRKIRTIWSKAKDRSTSSVRRMSAIWSPRSLLFCLLVVQTILAARSLEIVLQFNRKQPPHALYIFTLPWKSNDQCMLCI